MRWGAIQDYLELSLPHGSRISGRLLNFPICTRDFRREATRKQVELGVQNETVLYGLNGKTKALTENVRKDAEEMQLYNCIECLLLGIISLGLLLQ